MFTFKLRPRYLHLCWLLLCTVNCINSHCNQKTSSAFVSESEIESLIEQLAISQEQAVKAPVLTPSKDDPESDNRVIAYKAARNISSYGRAAFPCLIKHLNDSRQSVCFQRATPCDIAAACLCIIRGQLFDLPKEYIDSMSIMRTGADGQYHERPLAGKDLFDIQTIVAWLEQRRDKSLDQIQKETLEWVIEEETNIGFCNEKDKQEYLYPLEKQLRLIENRIQRSR